MPGKENTQKTDSKTNKKEPVVHTGTLFGPPDNQRNVLIEKGKKTGLVYGFKKGHKTLIHSDDVPEFEKRKFKKEE